MYVATAALASVRSHLPYAASSTKVTIMLSIASLDPLDEVFKWKCRMRKRFMSQKSADLEHCRGSSQGERNLKKEQRWLSGHSTGH